MFIELLKEWQGKPAGERIDVPEAYVPMMLESGIAKTIKGDPIGEMVNDYIAKAAEKMTASLNSVIDLTLKQFIDSHAQKSKAPFPLPSGEDPKAGFKHLGEFAHCVKHACLPGARPDDRLRALQSKTISGMGELNSSDGGFLVPPEFSTRVFERVYSTDQLLGMTDRYTVSGNGISFPRNLESSRADGSRKGGIRGFWVDEAAQITSSKPTFGRLALTLHKLAILAYVTDELLSDSAVALDQYLENAAVEEINFLIGDAIINGTGAGKPLGILSAGSTVSVAKETGQAAATVLSENVVKMWARLFAPSRNSAVWLINQDVEPQLLTMTLGVGTGGMLTYMPPGGLSGKPYGTLLGRPVKPVEWCATLGTVGDIILADLSQYVTITKGLVETALSMHLRFDFDESAFRFVFRVDGQPWWASALTPYKGSNTQSAFVTLATQ